MEEDCGCSNIPIIPNTDLPQDSVIVRAKPGSNIIVESFLEGGIRVFEVDYQAYTPPVINTTANPIREVGTVNDFTWNGAIVQGRNPIIRREITPSGADLNFPFNVSVEDDTRTTKGFNQAYHIEVEDDTNNVVTKDLGIQYYNKVFQGFTYKNGFSAGQTITASDLELMTATIAENIKSVYGGEYNYTIPFSGVLQYLVWAYEVGTAPINAMEYNNFDFPLIFIPGTIPVLVRNNAITLGQPGDYISVNYAVVISANRYGNGDFLIDMQ